ncbi:MAG: hypothetical protein KAS66_05855, partial [Candidatus Omnitrophica bacterium]|nr:hypothetical protein [Candidatus Omnitrophota bacterium]
EFSYEDVQELLTIVRSKNSNAKQTGKKGGKKGTATISSGPAGSPVRRDKRPVLRIMEGMGTATTDRSSANSKQITRAGPGRGQQSSPVRGPGNTARFLPAFSLLENSIFIFINSIYEHIHKKIRTAIKNGGTHILFAARKEFSSSRGKFYAFLDCKKLRTNPIFNWGLSLISSIAIGPLGGDLSDRGRKGTGAYTGPSATPISGSGSPWQAVLVEITRIEVERKVVEVKNPAHELTLIEKIHSVVETSKLSWQGIRRVPSVIRGWIGHIEVPLGIRMIMKNFKQNIIKDFRPYLRSFMAFVWGFLSEFLMWLLSIKQWIADVLNAIEEMCAPRWYAPVLVSGFLEETGKTGTVPKWGLSLIQRGAVVAASSSPVSDNSLREPAWLTYFEKKPEKARILIEKAIRKKDIDELAYIRARKDSYPRLNAFIDQMETGTVLANKKEKAAVKAEGGIAVDQFLRPSKGPLSAASIRPVLSRSVPEGLLAVSEFQSLFIPISKIDARSAYFIKDFISQRFDALLEWFTVKVLAKFNERPSWHFQDVWLEARAVFYSFIASATLLGPGNGNLFTFSRP